MVPCIDMVNHAAIPNASYVKSSDCGVNLCLRSGAVVKSGQEITISYGEKKSAAEMLFSYGFVDSEAAGDEKILVPVEPPGDDPLVMAKTRIYGEAPTVRISRCQDGGVQWECPFAYLLSLNEEDGLGIRLLQLNDGCREIRLFWEEQDVTGSVKSLQDVTKEHPRSKIFQLRTVVIVQETVHAQVERLSTGTGDHGTTTGVRPSCRSAALNLRETEERLLRDAADVLETEVGAYTRFWHGVVVTLVQLLESKCSENLESRGIHFVSAQVQTTRYFLALPLPIPVPPKLVLLWSSMKRPRLPPIPSVVLDPVATPTLRCHMCITHVPR